MSYTITRAFEQWYLSADTAVGLFSTSFTAVPFDTRNTAFPDLSNTISGGRLTLSAAVKADWSACRCHLSVNIDNSTIAGNVDYATAKLMSGGGLVDEFIDDHTGWSHIMFSARTPWFDHTGMTDLEWVIRADEPAFGARDVTATDGAPQTVWGLEFR